MPMRARGGGGLLFAVRQLLQDVSEADGSDGMADEEPEDPACLRLVVADAVKAAHASAVHAHRIDGGSVPTAGIGAKRPQAAEDPPTPLDGVSTPLQEAQGQARGWRDWG